ncbi:MAG: prepilin-type N-terminal cleavage/methylation domain-containing protein [Fimbriimonadaceae bacterium]|nr:prepilin-type N-terminal cleavage/methylation domain-containing protein [Fimbriimonadaceae bacterium]
MRHQFRQGFTLIELLVVIAIIAILAAILFPVFAQAKEAAKKTTGVSNTKQLGTANAIYLSDHDDMFPMAFSRRANGTWRYNNAHPCPENVIVGGGWDAPGVAETVRNQWAISLQPYVKNNDLYVPGGAQDATLAGEVFTAGVLPRKINLRMNGFLHTYSGTAIDNPSLVPAFWTGSGNLAIVGRSAANPSLLCTTNEECRFNPGAGPQPSVTAANVSLFFGYGNYSAGYRVWTYGGNQGGVIFSRADTSARYQRVGVAADPARNVNNSQDPYAAVTNNGAGFFYYATNDGNCANITAANTSGNNRYACFFRPDRQN